MDPVTHLHDRHGVFPLPKSAFTRTTAPVVRDNRLGGLNLFRPLNSLEFENFKKAGPEVFIELFQHAKLFETFAWFFDYPVMDTARRGDRTFITFGDLRFASTLSFVKRLQGKSLPFALTAVLDKNGELLEYHYHRPGREKEISRATQR